MSKDNAAFLSSDGIETFHVVETLYEYHESLHLRFLSLLSLNRKSNFQRTNVSSISYKRLRIILREPKLTLYGIYPNIHNRRETKTEADFKNVSSWL